MKVTRWVIGFATAVWWLVGTEKASRAGPPLITDDPDTPGQNRWEINVSYGLEITRERFELPARRRDQFLFDVAGKTWERLGLADVFELPEAPPRFRKRFSLEHELPLVDINYGVIDRDQVKLEVPVLIGDPGEGSTEGGIGNALFGYKFRFLDESEFPLSMSLYPQIEVPTGARRLGGNRKPVYTMPLQAGRHFFEDRLFVYGEIGFTAAPSHDAADALFYGVAGEFEVVTDLKLLGEINGTVPTHGTSESDVLFNLGVKWSISANLALMATVGRSFRSSGPEHPELIGFWGLQLTF